MTPPSHGRDARFAGKVALVLGAGSVGPGWGNGRATAALLARQGATVFGVDRDAAALAETGSMIAGEGGGFEARSPTSPAPRSLPPWWLPAARAAAASTCW